MHFALPIAGVIVFFAFCFCFVFFVSFHLYHYYQYSVQQRKKKFTWWNHITYKNYTNELKKTIQRRIVEKSIKKKQQQISVSPFISIAMSLVGIFIWMRFNIETKLSEELYVDTQNVHASIYISTMSTLFATFSFSIWLFSQVKSSSTIKLDIEKQVIGKKSSIHWIDCSNWFWNDPQINKNTS